MKAFQKYGFLIACSILAFILAINPFDVHFRYIFLFMGIIIIAASVKKSWIDGMFLNLFFNFSFYSVAKVFYPNDLLINIAVFTMFAFLGDRLKFGKRKEKKIEFNEATKNFYNKITAAFMAAHDMLLSMNEKISRKDIYNIFTKNILNMIGARQIIIFSSDDGGNFYLEYSFGEFPENCTEKTIPINFILSQKNKNLKLEELPVIKGEKEGFVVAIPTKWENKTGKVVVLYRKKEFDYNEIYIIEFLTAQLFVISEKQELFNKSKANYEKLIEALALAIDAKDHDTLGHSMETMLYAMKIAERLDLSDEEKNKIKYACLLHDLGKINISNKILKKPEALTEEEFDEIKKHPSEAIKILNKFDILKDTFPIIFHHHEHYNGNGYPENLKGKDIPIGARICAIADAYSVMLTGRPYKKALSKQEAILELKKYSGSQFDNDLVEIFLELIQNEGAAGEMMAPGQVTYGDSEMSKN